MFVCVCLLEQLDVAHDELLPVDEDHGHFLLRQQLTLQQRFVENLHTHTHTHRYTHTYTYTHTHTHTHIRLNLAENFDFYPQKFDEKKVLFPKNNISFVQKRRERSEIKQPPHNDLLLVDVVCFCAAEFNKF